MFFLRHSLFRLCDSLHNPRCIRMSITVILTLLFMFRAKRGFISHISPVSAHMSPLYTRSWSVCAVFFAYVLTEISSKRWNRLGSPSIISFKMLPKHSQALPCLLGCPFRPRLDLHVPKISYRKNGRLPLWRPHITQLVPMLQFMT